MAEESENPKKDETSNKDKKRSFRGRIFTMVLGPVKLKL